MDYLGRKVLYYDTDSIIYISDGYNDIETSETLGKFKDELLSEYGSDAYITEFVSGGPKNYAYRLNDGIIIEKIKGVTLHHENSKKLKFEKVKKFVLDSVNGIERKPITTCHNQFVKNPNDKTITIKQIDKNYNFGFDKFEICEINENMIDTLPFGYIEAH